MQPYFLPYIGYWQLLSAVDTFVLYDNIQYTKKGWINRNRFLRNGTDVLFTVPLKRDAEGLDVCRRSIAGDFKREKVLNRFAASYRTAPHFSTAFPILECVMNAEHVNLFQYIANSIRVVAGYLGVPTTIVVSSSIDIDHSQRGERKVLCLCQAMRADR